MASALKQQVAMHGRSMEAKHREILRDALKRPKRKSFKEVLLAMPDTGDDTDFERSRE